MFLLEGLLRYWPFANCVKETLRLFPPLIVLMRKVLTPVAYTMEDGMNYTIPKGDIVCISAAVQNRLPELFTDPHSFNPDRHGGTYPGALGTEAAETACRGVQLVDNKSKWIPFGGGRHAWGHFASAAQRRSPALSCRR